MKTKSPRKAQEKTAAKKMKTKNNFSDNFDFIDLDLHGVRLPSFHIPNEEKRKIKVSEDVNNYDFLRALCLDGFNKLDLKKNSKEYKEYVNRVKYELRLRFY
jgi:DNA polymerase III alpha subunit